ncbi:Phenylalanyl-tRNA synthetase class IIc beta subunit [Klebsormidium nitens]|uniref:phenylalanine--tRNA ligase n=1 Tax=Klebsormidium nitens TaxID=105231 RepID=A0A1Y1HRX6_KLENI|nr:Phenylalanyl-tRNA synthetase class IIc beta subunit [Klebsormidium nitens]|eukprot:GAQ81384.1 Phenylalanyl-tRNA synthetase class IIc beta subunit [Klebsormidium nitens]
MPTVSVGRDKLNAALGHNYSEKEFDELCFEFGIELDDVTSEKDILRKEKKLEDSQLMDVSDEVLYKIDVPANRYDLLCLEGLSRALRVFLGEEPVPVFRLADPGAGRRQRLVVHPETALIRPFVVAAILRGVSFDDAQYASFIDLQDKLHQNICRRRSLVAIGTHDLDTLQGPFTYEALPPADIKFVPLKQKKEFTAAELMTFYQSDNKLKKFLHIISDSVVFPVIYDSNRTVLSLPPIINGAHSAISTRTKNVFIECTATDLTKAKIVLNTMVTMFSELCADKFAVEPVEVQDASGSVRLYPDLAEYVVATDTNYVNKYIGLDLQPNQVGTLLNRMQLKTDVLPEGKLRVHVPPQRSDILHPVDVAEDVAIAHGFNNIPKTRPTASTVGREQPLNAFSDLLRLEVALAGFTEVLTWVLHSHEENFAAMNLRDDGKTAVIVGNPRSADFELARSSLLPSLLKTVGSNKDAPLPIKLFEISDVVLLDDQHEVGARNERRLVALHSNLTSGFEVIHGLVDRVLEMVGVDLAAAAQTGDYVIRPSSAPTFFPGRQADVFYRKKHIGTFGIIHPEVLEHFDIQTPCSALEIRIEDFLEV